MENIHVYIGFIQTQNFVFYSSNEILKKLKKNIFVFLLFSSGIPKNLYTSTVSFG